jgi:RHS repeat-associated protein
MSLVSPERTKMRSLVAGLCLAAVAATVSITVTAHPAVARPTLPSAPAKLRSVPGRDVAGGKPPVDTNPGLTAAPAVTWPRAGTAEVALGSAAAPNALAAPSWTWAPGLPVAARARSAGPRSLAAGTAVNRVALRVYDRTAAQAAGYDLVARVSRVDGGAAAGPVSVAVGYGGFARAYGGDWAGRLRLVALPECALTTPALKTCAPVDVPTSNDSANKLVTADVTAAPQGTLVALVAGPSSDGGTFSATDLKSSESWSGGGSSGGFAWSYPLRMPPSLGGPLPTVQLAYTSQSVDGQTAATNAQPSLVGEGFNWQPGSIERSYRSCSDDGQSTSHDLCWAGDNATMSLNGRSSILVHDNATGAWVPSSDDGTRVERLNDTTLGNGDNDGEYWQVTTPDGVQYFFGLNKLPGAPAGTTTDSVFYEPVFGNNTDEPCHASTFAASSCQQAYRWNLDYVLDPHSNSMSFYYTRETNQYARNGSSTDTPTYIRGGYAREIDYGTRKVNGVDSAFSGTAAARVRFDVLDRCITQGSTCTTAVANKSNWPDVPLDLICTGNGCANKPSPSFFTQKMLSGITTEVASGTKTWRRVEHWTFDHEFKSPGDGNAAILWLRGIGHCGVDDTACLPNVQFTATQKSNRVDKAGTTDSIIRFRLQTITNEYGEIISVTYSDPQCVPGVTMPANPETNTLRCFPQYWTPVGATSPKLEYFHKYLVTQVAIGDVIHSADEVTYYEYPGPAAWHYDNNPVALPTRRTWNDWRGYDLVRTVKGVATETQLKSESRYFRGMDADTLPNNAVRSVSLVDSDGVSWKDSDWFAGMTRETVTYLGNGSTVVSKVKNDPYQYGPTGSTVTNGVTLNAYATQTAATTSKTATDHAPFWFTTRTTNTFTPDRYARVLTTDDEGDVSTTADDRCTRYTFAANAAGTLADRPARAETVAMKCSGTPDRSKDVIADARFLYDGATSYGTSISGKGELTATQQMANWNGGSPDYRTMMSKTYDDNGRVTGQTDALGHTVGTQFTPATGPLTKTEATNAKGWKVTTTLDPAWGVPLSMVQPNGTLTQGTYDGLGRLTAMWGPGRARDQLPDNTYSYLVRNSGGPTVVTTGHLNAAGTGYNYTYELLDGQLRSRQTQMPAVGGGRQISETIYDSRGNPVKKRDAYFNSSAPGTTLFVPTGDTAVPSQTVTAYDGAGRAVRATLQLSGVEFSHTSTAYGGDHVDVTVPDGGSATSSWSDARGQLTQVRVFRGSVPTGAYDTSTRVYTRGGDLQSITDPAGNVWSYTYDQQHRILTETAPDRGRTTYTYDAIGERLTATDARGLQLTYAYDELGRQIAEYAGAATPANLIGSWTYDTLSKGKLTSSTRYNNGSAYTVAVTGYTARDQVAGTKVTIPAAAGSALAGDYTTSTTYNLDGTINTTTMAARSGAATTGGLAPETLTFGYNELGLPTTLSGQTSYVTDTQYLQTGELSSINATNGNGKNILQYWTYEPGTKRLANHQVLGDFTGTVAQDASYTYDKAGDVVSISDRIAQYGTGQDDTQCFAYDGSQRLTEAWTPRDGNCAAARSVGELGGPAPYWNSYAYTAAGNRNTETRHTGAGDLTRTSQYPASGASAVRPHAVTEIDNRGLNTAKDTFAYDADGNMTSRSIAGKPSQSLTWTGDGLLASVSDTNGQTSYVYDANGARLLAKGPTSTTLYLGQTELKLSGGTVSATRTYTFGTHTVAVRTLSGLFWQTEDGQGTGQLSFRASDLSVTRRRTDAFGNERGGPAPWPTSRGFLGATADDTGLTHLGAREYDPVAGAFISVDPLLSTQDLQQMSTYSYADNNPVSKSDPDGRDPGGACEIAHLCGSDGKANYPIEVPPFILWDSHDDPTPKDPKHTKQQRAVHRVVIFYKKTILMAVTCGPGAPQACKDGIFVLGESSGCGAPGLDPQAAACWVGGDGHIYDLEGHRSCDANKIPCPSGAPAALNLGCGPKGAPPNGWVGQWPPTEWNRALPEDQYIKPEKEECEGRGDQCKVAMMLKDALGVAKFCWLQVCGLFGLLGGMVMSGYYLSTGDNREAAQAALEGAFEFWMVKTYHEPYWYMPTPKEADSFTGLVTMTASVWAYNQAADLTISLALSPFGGEGE